MEITEKTFDLLTGKETITERNETDLEAQTRLKREAELAMIKAEAEAKAAQKAALLNRLGITEDEAKLLLA